MKITIPGRLPGYNELTKGHWRKCHQIKTDAMNIVTVCARAARIRPVEGMATVAIKCYEPTLKRDPSNVRAGAEKVILDALQNCGIIHNDNWRWLEDVPTIVELDRQHPRVEIEVTDNAKRNNNNTAAPAN